MSNQAALGGLPNIPFIAQGHSDHAFIATSRSLPPDVLLAAPGCLPCALPIYSFPIAFLVVFVQQVEWAHLFLPDDLVPLLRGQVFHHLALPGLCTSVHPRTLKKRHRLGSFQSPAIAHTMATFASLGFWGPAAGFFGSGSLPVWLCSLPTLQ
jgi:hypothetical protein